MAETISKDMLKKMLKNMDVNGDGKVDKNEFNAPYMKLFPSTTEKQFDDVWAAVDSDKSGDVSVEELADFYGFTIGENGELEEKPEMSDEQILEALAMAAELSVVPEVSPPEIKKTEKRASQIERVKAFKCSIMAKEGDLEKELLEECLLGNAKGVIECIDKLKEAERSVRCECHEKGEMPLHKLARFGDKCLDAVRKLLEEGGKAREDINYPDNSGKTPLHWAAEYKQPLLFKLLLGQGANPLITSQVGWTVLHTAVHSNSIELVGLLLNLDKERATFSKQQKEQLVRHTDGQGRTALHLAAFKADENMVQLLLDHGADPRGQDTAGNNAGALATKTGRRRSRDLLDIHMGVAPAK